MVEGLNEKRGVSSGLDDLVLLDDAETWLLDTAADVSKIEMFLIGDGLTRGLRSPWSSALSAGEGGADEVEAAVGVRFAKMDATG